jgi:hypothetical protein
MSLIPALRSQRQKDLEFKASLEYSEMLFQKEKNTRLFILICFIVVPGVKPMISSLLNKHSIPPSLLSLTLSFCFGFFCCC